MPKTVRRLCRQHTTENTRNTESTKLRSTKNTVNIGMRFPQTSSASLLRASRRSLAAQQPFNSHRTKTQIINSPVQESPGRGTCAQESLTSLTRFRSRSLEDLRCVFPRRLEKLTLISLVSSIVVFLGFQLMKVPEWFYPPANSRFETVARPPEYSRFMAFTCRCFTLLLKILMSKSCYCMCLQLCPV